MAFMNAFNISASGLSAQRMRLDVAAENITNINTTRTQAGGAYKRKMVVFESIGGSDFQKIFNETALRNGGRPAGVRVSEIVEDDRAFKSVYNPNHPDADEQGYVMMPNVDLLKETVDSMAATRAYDANVTAFNAIKTMAAKALEIGR